MKDRRKNKTKRKVLLALYLAVCLVIIVAAYFHLSRIARNFNTEHLELITGLYAEKMNDSMEYLQNYVQEDIKMIRSMENAQPEEILEQKQLREEVYAALMQLTAIQARRIYARFYLGMTVAEIARIEGADRRRVWESIRRGLKKLARLLDTAR